MSNIDSSSYSTIEIIIINNDIGGWWVFNQRMGIEWDYYTGVPAWGEHIEAWSGQYASGWIFPLDITLDANDPKGTYPSVSWFVGSRAVNVSNFYAAPYSFHPATVQVVLGDGRVRPLSENVSVELVSALSSCDGGELNTEF